MIQKQFFKLIYALVFALLFYFNLSLSAEEILNKTDENPVHEEQQIKEKSSSAKKDKIAGSNFIVITATRTKEKIKDLPVHVDVITSKDIEGTGKDTLGDVIGQTITGHYHRYTGLSQSAGLTGNLTANAMGDHTGDRVIVLVDGHRLGTGNLGKIPPEIIERVEVMKGPASAIYGSNAMGGVINIITKKGDSNITNTAKLEKGSFEYERVAVTSGGVFNEMFSYFATGSYMESGDYKTKNYGTAYNTSVNHAQLWGNLSFFPAPNQSVRLGFSYADIQSYYPEWQGYAEHTYYDETAKQYSDISRGHCDMEYNLSLLQNKLNWKAMIYSLWDRRSWFTATTGKPEDDASISNDYITGTDQQFEISLLPFNKIVAGYIFELLKRDSKTREAGVQVKNSTPDFNYYTNGIYIQDKINILKDRLIFIFGARYDRFDLDSDNSGPESKDASYDNISPRGGFVFKIFDMFRIRANAGNAFRAPNADELSMEMDTGGYGIYRGNPHLKPEKSTTYEAGFDIYTDYINTGGSYSYIKTKNFITYVLKETSPTYIYEYENVNKADMEIVNCYVNWSAGKTFTLPVGLNLSSNITFNRKYEDKNTGDKLPFIPDREIKSALQAIYKSLNLTLSHVYVGHEHLKNGDKKCSFYFLNLSSAYDISSNFSAQIAVNNLTNKEYEWVRGYPMPERNYKIGLTGKF